LQIGIKVVVKSKHQNLKLKFVNHFIDGGHVGTYVSDVECTDEINAVYIANVIRRSFKGALICQLQSKSAFPNDTFIIVGWETSIFRDPRRCLIVVETECNNSIWDEQFLKDKYKSLHNQYMTCTKHAVETWRLGNDEVIRLTSSLGYDKNYWLMITISEGESSDKLDNIPVWIAKDR
jgi:hypothetical protein